VQKQSLSLERNEGARTLTLFISLDKRKDSSTRFRAEGMTEKLLRLDVMRILTVGEAMNPQNMIFPNWSKGWTI
jgi:hypothetical protein